ncbi:twin-arginine translocase TatA/TatE family subunit [candidate division KSB1 bacterium]|nr:twin-arginine translocase TatA/TatE family subunit [candidate division KSB1 bacterium]
MPGGWELVVIVFVILLLFGAKKLPELAQGLGKGIKEFKKATTETEDDDKKANSYDEKSEKHSA